MKDGTNAEEFGPEAHTYELILREARIEDRDTWRHVFMANGMRLLATEGETKLYAQVIAMQKLLRKWEEDLNARFRSRQKKGEMGALSIESPCTHLDSDSGCKACADLPDNHEPLVLEGALIETVQ